LGHGKNKIQYSTQICFQSIVRRGDEVEDLRAATRTKFDYLQDIIDLLSLMNQIDERDIDRKKSNKLYDMLYDTVSESLVRVLESYNKKLKNEYEQNLQQWMQSRLYVCDHFNYCSWCFCALFCALLLCFIAGIFCLIQEKILTID